MSLRRRLYQLVGFALVPVLVIQVTGSILSYRKELAKIHDNALRYARLVADDVNSQIKDIENTLITLSMAPVVRGDPAACEKFFKDVAGNLPNLVGLSYIGRDAILRCSITDNPTKTNYSDWPPFREAREKGRFTVSPLVKGENSKRMIIPLLLPLRDPAGEFDGVISASLDVLNLNEQFSSKAMPPDSNFGVFDSNGTIIVRVPFVEGVVGTPILPANRYILDAKEASTVTAVLREGKEMIIGIIPVSETPFDVTVAFGIDRKKSLWPVQVEAIRNIGAISLGLLLSALSAAFFARRLIREPVDNLIATIERQRAGDLAARVDVTNKDTELGKLGHAFNSLAEEISAKTQSLAAALKLQKEMMAELDHRVKNTLANIRSIAHQSFTSGRPVNEIETVFVDRIMAMAGAHRLLSEASWGAIDIGELAATVLKPHRDASENRIRIVGPSIRLLPNTALALGMVLHELCTNAAKHGALSNKTGHVDLTWEIANGVFTLKWKESGGPSVSPTERRSFGSRLIETALLHDHGKLDYNFLPEGVEFQVSSPLANWTDQT